MLAKMISVRADWVIDTCSSDCLGLKQIISKELRLMLGPLLINTQVIQRLSWGVRPWSLLLWVFAFVFSSICLSQDITEHAKPGKVGIKPPSKKVGHGVRDTKDRPKKIPNFLLRKTEQMSIRGILAPTLCLEWTKDSKEVKWFRRVEKIKCYKVESQHFFKSRKEQRLERKTSLAKNNHWRKYT